MPEHDRLPEEPFRKTGTKALSARLRINYQIAIGLEPESSELVRDRCLIMRLVTLA